MKKVVWSNVPTGQLTFDTTCQARNHLPNNEELELDDRESASRRFTGLTVSPLATAMFTLQMTSKASVRSSSRCSCSGRRQPQNFSVPIDRVDKIIYNMLNEAEMLCTTEQQIY